MLGSGGGNALGGLFVSIPKGRVTTRCPASSDADEPLRFPEPLCKIGRTARHVMRVGRKDLDEPFLQHSVGPITRASSKSSRYRSRCDLHPHALRGETSHHIVLAFDPSKPLGVGQNRDVTAKKNAEEELFKPCGRDVVRRLNQDIGGISEREEAPLL